MPERDEYEITYRYAGGKIHGHMIVNGLDELLRQLKAFNDEGTKIDNVHRVQPDKLSSAAEYFPRVRGVSPK